MFQMLQGGGRGGPFLLAAPGGGGGSGPQHGAPLLPKGGVRCHRQGGC